MSCTDSIRLEEKKKILLDINALRERIRSYKFIHVLAHDKFTKSIVDFINRHFSTAEHCFLINPRKPEFPPPTGENIFCHPFPECLAVSDKVSKVLFHGLYDMYMVQYLYDHPDILQKSYWLVWGGDLYDAPNHPVSDYVRRNFKAIAGDIYTKNAYEQKYGSGKACLPFNICFESIPYETIVTTPIPKKDYIQIQVNNSTHSSTLEVFNYLQKFAHENIKIVTILSYGVQKWCDEIICVGQKLFGDKFLPVTRYIPPEYYIKLLAINDVYILNQHRPQGMTTAFTSMVMGKKVFMRETVSGYLREEGYALYATASLPQLPFEELTANPAVEENRRLALQCFDERHVKQTWANIFDHEYA